MKEKIKRLMKNKNAIMVICVFILTIFTLGYSYAAFFTVKTNKNNQTITTGTLEVSYGGESSSITKTDMVAIPDSEGLAQTEASVIYIQNTGTLDSDYVLTIGYDMADFLSRADYDEQDVLTPIEFIKVAVYEYNGTDGSTLITGPITVADLPIYKMNSEDERYNRYAIVFGNLGTTENTTKTYQVKIWLSDKATSAVSDSFFYVNSEVIAEASNTKMNYNIAGKLVDNNGNVLSGATISIQNNSYVTTTAADGTFALNGILPNTYNVDITYNNVTYTGNLTVREGSSTNITSMGTTFTPGSTMTANSVAYTYGTTVNKLKSVNDLTTSSNNLTFDAEETYKLMPSYILTGSANFDIGTLTITINDTSISNMILN